jgi:hypothetical protein
MVEAPHNETLNGKGVIVAPPSVKQALNLCPRIYCSYYTKIDYFSKFYFTNK